MSLLQNQDFVITQLRASYLQNSHDGIGKKIVRPTHLYITKHGPSQLNWGASTLLSGAVAGSPPISTMSLADGFNSRRKLWGKRAVGSIPTGNNDTNNTELNNSNNRHLRPRASTLPTSVGQGSEQILGRNLLDANSINEYDEDEMIVPGAHLDTDNGTSSMDDSTTTTTIAGKNGTVSSSVAHSIAHSMGPGMDNPGLLASHLNGDSLADSLDSPHAQFIEEDSDIHELEDMDYTSSEGDGLSDNENDDLDVSIDGDLPDAFDEASSRSMTDRSRGFGSVNSAEPLGVSEDDDSDMEEDMRFAVEQIKLRNFEDNMFDTDSVVSYNPSPSARARAQSVTSGIPPQSSNPLIKRLRGQKSMDLMSLANTGSTTDSRSSPLAPAPANGGPRHRRMSTPSVLLSKNASGSSTPVLAPSVSRRRNTEDSPFSDTLSPMIKPQTTKPPPMLIDTMGVPAVQEEQLNQQQQPPLTPASAYFSPRQLTPSAHSSKLTASIKVKNHNPLDYYIIASGKGERNALKVSMYMPTSDEPKKPWVIILKPDTVVATAIGFALYSYVTEKRQPDLPLDDLNPNKWNLCMVDEDGDLDDDFTVVRTRVLSTYGSDEFALVKASENEARENERLTPAKISRPSPSFSQQDHEASATQGPVLVPVVSRTVRVYAYPYDEIVSKPVMTFSVDSTARIGQVLAKVCSERGVDQQMFTFQIPGTRILVINSSEIGSLPQANLELTPKRVITAGNGYDPNSIVSASRVSVSVPKSTPLSSSSSAATIQPSLAGPSFGGIGSSIGAPVGSGLSGPAWNRHKQIQKQAENNADMSLIRSSLGPEALLTGAGYQKYFIWRRQPMSFISRHERILAIDGEYVHIMPSEDRAWFDSPKTSSFHINKIIKCKQSTKVPVNFKIVIMKTSGPKRYDLEAVSPAVALEIVTKLRRLAQKYHEL